MTTNYSLNVGDGSILRYMHYDRIGIKDGRELKGQE